MCSCKNEDCFHPVIDCPHAKSLRRVMRKVWCLSPEERLRDVGPEWFLVLLDSWWNDEVALLAMIMWRAWSMRNKVTRAGEALSIEDSVHFLQRHMVQYQEAHDPKASGRSEQSGGITQGMVERLLR
jgi:hypothetical protein